MKSYTTFTIMLFMRIGLTLSDSVSGKNPPGKKPPREESGVGSRLGIGLGLESGGIFSGGIFPRAIGFISIR